MDLFRQKFFHNNPTFRDYTAYLQKQLTPVLRDQEDNILAVIPRVRHQFIVDNIPTDPLYEKIYLDTGNIIDNANSNTYEIPSKYYISEIFGFGEGNEAIIDISINEVQQVKSIELTTEDTFFKVSELNYLFDPAEDYYLLTFEGADNCRLIFVLTPYLLNNPIPDVNLVSAEAISETKILLTFDKAVTLINSPVATLYEGESAMITGSLVISRDNPHIVEFTPFEYTIPSDKEMSISISSVVLSTIGGTLQTVTKFPVTLNIVIPT